jgi:cytochrome P450
VTDFVLDLADPSLWAGGFSDEVFTELRHRAPVYHQELTNLVNDQLGREFWVCTRHAEVNQVHRDYETFTATDGPLIQELGLFAAYPSIVNLDPPDHTKRRRIIAKAFTPRAVAKLEDGIRSRAHLMARSLLDNGGGEFVDLAAGLPISVIGDIVGIPDEARPRVFELIAQVLKLAGAGIATPEADNLRPFLELFEYASELTAHKRDHPVDDIWSSLCTAELEDEDGSRFLLPANELEIFFFILGLAGSDTTRNAIDTGATHSPGGPPSRKCCATRRRSCSGCAVQHGTWCWPTPTSPKVPGWLPCCGRPTATRMCSTGPSTSTSREIPTPTSLSAGAARTIASARCWPAPRSAPRSTNCC